MKRILFLSTILLSLFSANFVFAQTPNQGTVVASVSLSNVKIVSQNKRDFVLSFDLSNKIGAQPEVKYAVRLMKTTSTSEVVADEKVYDETLSLDQNSKINRTVNYSIPKQLSAGTYNLYLDVENESGLMLGIAFLGGVKVVENIPNTIEIVPESCFLAINTKEYQPGQSAYVQSTGDHFVVKCLLRSSLSANTIFTPSFVTRKHTIFGETVPAIIISNILPMEELSETSKPPVPGETVPAISTSPTSITVKNGQNNISIDLPVASKPQDYNLTLYLTSSDGKITSNNIILNYVLAGETGTIKNVVFDKTYYKTGETANLQIFSTQNGTSTISVLVSNDAGDSCSATSSKEISNLSIIDLSIPIIKNCSNPQANITIYNKTTGLLDSKNFKVIPLGTLFTNKTILIILLVTIFLLIFGFMIHKKKYSTLKVLAIFLFGLSAFFGSTKQASAWNYDCGGEYDYTGGSWSSFYIYVNSTLANPYIYLVLNSAGTSFIWQTTFNVGANLRSPSMDLGYVPPYNVLRVRPQPGKFTSPGDCEWFELTRPAPPPPPPPAVTLQAPSTIPYGGFAILSWSVTGNMSSCTLTGNGNTIVTGASVTSANVSSGNITAPTTFSLSCSGAGGNTTKNVTIAILSPLTVNISATSNLVSSGDSTTVSWNATNTASCNITKNGAPWPTGGPITPNSFGYSAQFGSLGSGNGQFNFSSSSGIVIDSSNYIYVTDTNNNRVQKFDAIGNYQTFSGLGGFSKPSGIAIDSGNVYVADTNNNRVQICTTAGACNITIGAYGTSCSSGNLNRPSGVTVNSGNIYVSDTGNNCVKQFNGVTYNSLFNSTGYISSGLSGPSGIAFNSGNIYVADTNNNQIQKFNSSGSYISQFNTLGTGNGTFSQPKGISLDSFGNIYTVDTNNNRVLVSNPSGTQTSSFGSLGSGNGQLNKPSGIAISPSGDAYVVDSGNNRVQRFSLSNIKSTSANSGPLTTDTTFAISCTGLGGGTSGSASTVVKVLPPLPTISVSSSPSSVNLNSNSTINWSSTNASSCTLEKNGSDLPLPVSTGPWVAQTPAENNAWDSIAYGNGVFVAVAYSGVHRVMTSSDGINWTPQTAAEVNNWYSVAYGNGLFVAVSSGGGVYHIMTSPDGVNWTGRTGGDASSWYGITYGNGLFVVTSYGGTNSVMTSPDGINWTMRTALGGSWYSVTYGKGLFVAVSNTGTNRIMTSPDGINWTARSAPEANTWFSVTYGKGLFVAVAYSGVHKVMTSLDGINWTVQNSPSTSSNFWYSVTYGNGLFIAVSNVNSANNIMTSPDGINWTPQTAAEVNNWTSVAFGNGQFVSLANSGPGAHKVMKSISTNTSSGSVSSGNLTTATTIVVSCAGPGGTASNSIVIPVLIPPTVSISASPTSITSGQTSTVSWSSTNANSCTISEGANLSWKSGTSSIGVASDPLTIDTTFVATCTGPGGVNSTSTKIRTTPGPTVSISSASTMVSPGSNTTISWTATNVNSCTITKNGGSWKTSTPTLSYLSQFGSLGTGNGQFDGPRGIAIDPSGNLYITDVNNNRIQKFNSSGSYLSQFIVNQKPSEVALDSSGNLYVTSSYYFNVQKFNPSGTALSSFGGPGSPSGLFSYPSGITLDSSGNIYVADAGNNRIQKFNSSGSFLLSFGSAGSSYGKFSWPYGVTLDPSGNIYVADTVNNRIQKFNSAGTIISAFGIAGTGDVQFNYPYGVILDSSGNIYVTDTFNNRVQKFNSSGSYLAQFGSTGSGDGQFNRPIGIALDSSSNIYVADYLNNRVQKFSQNNINISTSSGSISTNTTFAVTCTGPGGTATDNIQVLVSGPSATINSDQNQVSPNATAKITWSSTDANSCTISEGANTSWKTGLSGSIDSDPLTADTLFKIKCTGAGGGTAESSTTITILGPQATITASPMSVASNDTSTISWNSTNADSCEITEGGTPWRTDLSGSATSDPIPGDSAVTFTITCTGPVGSVTDSVTVSSGNASTNEKEYFTCQPPTGTLFINKPTTWTIPTSHTITGTDWSGTNISGAVHTSGKTFTKTYTTIGRKYINATSTGSAGTALDPKTYTAVCSNSAVLFAPSGTSTEI